MRSFTVGHIAQFRFALRFVSLSSSQFFSVFLCLPVLHIYSNYSFSHIRRFFLVYLFLSHSISCRISLHAFGGRVCASVCVLSRCAWEIHQILSRFQPTILFVCFDCAILNIYFFVFPILLRVFRLLISVSLESLSFSRESQLYIKEKYTLVRQTDRQTDTHLLAKQSSCRWPSSSIVFLYFFLTFSSSFPTFFFSRFRFNFFSFIFFFCSRNLSTTIEGKQFDSIRNAHTGLPHRKPHTKSKPKKNERERKQNEIGRSLANEYERNPRTE